MTELQLQQQSNMLANQERIFKLSEFLSSSDIIPTHFRNKPANVFIALEMANRLGVDFFELAQGLYVVHGKPGFSGAFIIARINASGIFKTKLSFHTKGTGNDMEVTAYATAKDGTECHATVPMSMAITEGWAKNTKYKSMQEQMLTYRAAGFFCRKHCPQVLMGTNMVEEIQDEYIAEKVESPKLVEAIKEIDESQKNQNNVEKIEKLFVKATELGVPKSALDNLKINLEDSKNVLQNIDFLETMIIDKQEELEKDKKKKK